MYENSEYSSDMFDNTPDTDAAEFASDCSGMDIFQDSEAEVIQSADEASTLKLPSIKPQISRFKRESLRLNLKKHLMRTFFKDQISRVLESPVCKGDQSLKNAVNLESAEDTNQVFFSLLFTTLVYCILTPKGKNEAVSKFVATVNRAPYFNIQIENSFVDAICQSSSQELKDQALKAMQGFNNHNTPSEYLLQ